MNPNLSVNIGGLKLKNPVMVASGTFGYAEEFSGFINLKKLGAIVTKTITINPRSGNPMPRTCETPAGMINSIGLENPGIEVFINKKMPYLKKLAVPIIVSISSERTPEEFIFLAERLKKVAGVCAIELNISCPNLKKEKLISQDANATFQTVKSVKRVFDKAVIAKLSPNVTDIVEIARAAEEAGADGLALINTISGMSIDVEKRKAKIAMVSGGLSGPAIRPVAVKMVWDVYRKVRIPIIGMGGIMDISSALEFFIAGASAVSVGTANFINPKVTAEILEGLPDYMKKAKISDLKHLTGSLKNEC